MANVGVTDAAAIIQEVVDAIVQETLIQNSVVLPSIMNVSDRVGPGMDTLKLPRFSQLAAVSKAEDTPLTPAAPTISTDDLILNKHRAVAWRLEDIANIQSKVDINTQLIEDAARTLAEKVDDDLITELLATPSAAAPDHQIDFANAPTDTIQEQDILEMRRLLDVAKVPNFDRFLLLGPSQEKAMLQLSNFIQADRYGSSQPIQNGEIGMVYGIRVIKTSSSSLAADQVLLYHRTAIAYAAQLSARLERERKVLELAEDFVLSMIYGVKGLFGGVKHVKIG